MPDIEKIEPTLHQPLDPYHWHYDNLPLQTILERQELINSAVDINSKLLRDATGTQGTIANRLQQSIDEDGTLKDDAIDIALHNIAQHTDGNDTLTSDEIDDIAETLGYVVSNPVPYVRMLEAERSKLALISDNATALKLMYQGASTTTTYEDETIELVDTDTATWEITSPNKLGINLSFPADAAHAHIYGAVPVASNLMSPDYINYKTTSVATPYIYGSLRVYLNGIRLNATDSVYVPGPDGPSGTSYLTKFTPDSDAGTFALSRAIDSDDIIVIDFDVSYS